MTDGDAAAPVIPPRWCTCGKRLMWCGVREAWVDSAHRTSHDTNGHRERHNTRGMQTKGALEARK